VSDAALRDIVRYYTREAGVRALEREVSKICRKAVKQLLPTRRRRRKAMPPQAAPHHRHAEEPRQVPRRARYTFGMARRRTRSARSPASPGPRSAASC
jgi:ATP-dependent Lon protease